MIIEKMNIGDYDEVYSLWISTPGMGLNNIDDSREGIEKYLRRNPDSCFAAREGDTLAGAILCGHDGRRGNIHHTAVAEEYRQRGVGRALVEAAVNALKAEGITKISFVVFGRNEEGNRFWEALGFGCRDDLVVRDRLIIDAELIRIDT